MKFGKRIEELKKINKDRIMLARCGVFVIAIGEDAKFLTQIFGFKLTCFKSGICKIGIPVTYTIKYLKMIEDKGYSYILYDYNKDTKDIEEKYKYDRIVHTFYVENFLKPYFLPQFIQTSYACIQKRGMHKACIDVQKAMKHCRKIWDEYYILKMDISKFFQNIDKDILIKILKRKIKDKDLMWLTKEIIYSNEGKKNLPIGNYTSQMFANIYLNEIDQYIKHKLKIKFYFRYMDDSILFVKTKLEAKETLEKIKVFLKEKLELELNKKTQIFKNKQGVNFCGYKINEYRLKIRDKGKRKLKKKIKKLKYEIKIGKITSKEAHKYLAGHLGYIKIANTYNLENKLFYKE